MKLRIQDNSIRLRLTRREVERLGQDQEVVAFVSFPGGARFEYALESSPLTGQPRADFSADRLVVRLPQSRTREWAAGEEVSIQGEQRLDDRDVLSILVEKDFACLAPREGEDESELFPHPLKGQETC